MQGIVEEARGVERIPGVESAGKWRKWAKEWAARRAASEHGPGPPVAVQQIQTCGGAAAAADTAPPANRGVLAVPLRQ